MPRWAFKEIWAMYVPPSSVEMAEGSCSNVKSFSVSCSWVLLLSALRESKCKVKGKLPSYLSLSSACPCSFSLAISPKSTTGGDLIKLQLIRLTSIDQGRIGVGLTAYSSGGSAVKLIVPLQVVIS